MAILGLFLLQKRNSTLQACHRVLDPVLFVEVRTVHDVLFFLVGLLFPLSESLDIIVNIKKFYYLPLNLLIYFTDIDENT